MTQLNWSSRFTGCDNHLKAGTYSAERTGDGWRVWNQHGWVVWAGKDLADFRPE